MVQQFLEMRADANNPNNHDTYGCHPDDIYCF